MRGLGRGGGGYSRAAELPSPGSEWSAMFSGGYRSGGEHAQGVQPAVCVRKNRGCRVTGEPGHTLLYWEDLTRARRPVGAIQGKDESEPGTTGAGSLAAGVPVSLEAEGGTPPPTRQTASLGTLPKPTLRPVASGRVSFRRAHKQGGLQVPLQCPADAARMFLNGPP